MPWNAGGDNSAFTAILKGVLSGMAGEQPQAAAPAAQAPAAAGAPAGAAAPAPAAGAQPAAPTAPVAKDSASVADKNAKLRGMTMPEYLAAKRKAMAQAMTAASPEAMKTAQGQAQRVEGGTASTADMMTYRAAPAAYDPSGKSPAAAPGVTQNPVPVYTPSAGLLPKKSTKR